MAKDISAQQMVDTARIYELQQVEVNAVKRPSVIRATTPLQTITGGDIARLGYQSLADVVRRFNGVSVKDYGGIGGLKTVSVRNLGAHHTAVVYDGIAVSNCQAGQIDIGRFSLDNVAMISLAIGQDDDIFRSARMFASAGVLNIQTEQPAFSKKPYALQAQIKGGAFGMINPYLRYARRITERTALSVDGNFMRADGAYPFILKNGNLETKEKRYNSDILSWNTEMNLYHYFKDSSRLVMKAYYFDSERGLPGSVILYNRNATERLWDKNFFAQAGYEKWYNPHWALKASVKYNYSWNKYEDVNVKYQGGKQTDRHRQREYYGSATVLYKPFSGFSASLATDFAVNTLRNNIPDCPFPTRYTSLTALAVRYQYRFLTVTANLLNTWITEKVEQGIGAADRYKLTPSVSLSLRPWDNQNLYVRLLYKNTFRVPTFNDLYYNRIGNAGLKPELAREYNIGITWSGKPFEFTDFLSLTADAYYNRVDDKIVARPTTYVWKMMNMGKVDITGVEFNLMTLIPVADRMTLRVSAGYTWQSALDVTDPEEKNYKEQIPYTPEHSGNGAVNMELPWVNLSYTLMAVSERYSLPQNVRTNRVEGYAEHSAAVSREFKMKSYSLRLQAELVNFTDKQYDVIQYYPMPGRSYRLTAGIKF